jgi:thiol-disulfide isomerase/thioredoxin
MRLSSLIKQLPISLLISVLVASASAIVLRDSEIQQITSQEDFKTKDLLFVEFYSPTCPHCKKFAATWDLLFNASLSMDGVGIARVDCSLSEGTRQQS